MGPDMFPVHETLDGKEIPCCGPSPGVWNDLFPAGVAAQSDVQAGDSDNLLWKTWGFVFGILCFVFRVWCFVFGVWCFVLGLWYLVR